MVFHTRGHLKYSKTVIGTAGQESSIGFKALYCLGGGPFKIQGVLNQAQGHINLINVCASCVHKAKGVAKQQPILRFFSSQRQSDT